MGLTSEPLSQIPAPPSKPRSSDLVLFKSSWPGCVLVGSPGSNPVRIISIKKATPAASSSEKQVLPKASTSQKHILPPGLLTLGRMGPGCLASRKGRGKAWLSDLGLILAPPNPSY